MQGASTRITWPRSTHTSTCTAHGGAACVHTSASAPHHGLRVQLPDIVAVVGQARLVPRPPTKNKDATVCCDLGRVSVARCGGWTRHLGLDPRLHLCQWVRHSSRQSAVTNYQLAGRANIRLYHVQLHIINHENGALPSPRLPLSPSRFPHAAYPPTGGRGGRGRQCRTSTHPCHTPTSR